MVRLPTFFLLKRKKPVSYELYRCWCARQESNLHPEGSGPKPDASASSATGAHLLF